jgi:hypothetical protein
MAQIVIGTPTPINTGVINEDGEVLTFAQYINGLWEAQNATVMVTTTNVETTVNYSVLPTGYTQPQLVTELDILAVSYNAKVLSAIEQIVFDYNAGLYVDYKKARKALQDLVHPTLPGSWVTMTINEKLICSKWFIVPESMRSQVYTIQEQQENGKIFDSLSIKSRDSRFMAGKMLIYNMLDFNDAKVIINEIAGECTVLATVCHSIDKNYILYGVESQSLGDNVGIFDYVDTVLRNKPFTPYAGTMSDLADSVLDILENGNYTA